MKGRDGSQVKIRLKDGMSAVKTGVLLAPLILEGLRRMQCGTESTDQVGS